MQTHRVVITPQGQLDLLNAYDYYKKSSTTIANANKKIIKLAKRIQSLELFPEGIKLVDVDCARGLGIRRVTIGKFSIMFVVRKNEVYVFAIWWATSDIDAKLRSIDSTVPDC